jgi:hypothetical protein
MLGWGAGVVGIVLVLLLLWVHVRVISAEQTRNNPPAAWQLLGGT